MDETLLSALLFSNTWIHNYVKINVERHSDITIIERIDCRKLFTTQQYSARRLERFVAILQAVGNNSCSDISIGNIIKLRSSSASHRRNIYIYIYIYIYICIYI